MNRYGRLLAGTLRIQTVEGARLAVARLGGLYDAFAALDDTEGTHQCRVMALIGWTRAHRAGYTECAAVYLEWLARQEYLV